MTPIQRLLALFGRDPESASRGPKEAPAFIALAESAPCAVFVSRSGVIRYANPAATAVAGLRREDLVGRSLLDLVHADFRGAFLARQTARGRRELVPARFELKLVGPRGADAWVDASDAAVAFDGGAAEVLMAYDITDRKLAEGHVRESERRLRDLIESVQLVAVLLDAEGAVTFANPYLLELVGCEEEEVVGRNWFDTFAPEGRREALKAAFRERIERGVMAPVDEYEIVTSRGERRFIAWNNTLLHEPGRGVVGAAFIGSDVTERRRAEERLLHDALHDALTGLPNRFLFMDRLAAAVGRLRRRPGHIFAVVLLDLDRFKLVNDSLGHAAGDQLLVRLASVIGSTLRREHTLARLGGDEFAVLVEDVQDQRDVLRVVERIDAALGEPIAIDGQDLFVRASTGVAFSAASYERAEDVLRDADTALSQAKTGGRARYAIFDASMHDRAIRQLRVEHSLRRAIENAEMRLYYQPIVALADGRVAGLEALIRWQHPERGVVSPYEFIQVAEETGLIYAIGRWTLREACRCVKQWEPRLPAGLAVNVNLSGSEFSQADLGAQIEAALAESGLPPSRFKFEITESVIMKDPEAAVGLLVRLRELGPGICIDDFGTGYSSLAYLLRFPADTLKIDRSFVIPLGRGGREEKIVAAVVSMATSLGMRVVAEGIETAEQWDALAQLGCGYGQGYLFSRPVPEADVPALLERGVLGPSG